MAQALEMPYNGVSVEGGLPSAGPQGSAASFLSTRNIRALRVPLDPRIVMPPGSSGIPTAVQGRLLALADSAIASPAGQAPLSSRIEWALLGCTEPTSATASRRPWLDWLANFWVRVDDLLGSHPATWGYALLTSPTVGELAAANHDPHPLMADHANLSWPASDKPSASAGPWLEAITAEVAARLSGTAANILVPLIHDRYTTDIAAAHPGGPWIDDAAVWYEAAISPMGNDGFQVFMPYASYRSDAAALDRSYRDIWYESAYFTVEPGTSPVIDPIPLTRPEHLPLPVEGASDSRALPVTALVASPLNSGAALAWTPPADMGDGTFIEYLIDSGGYGWFTTTSPLANIGPLPNGSVATFVVTVVTTVGQSTSASIATIPTAGSGEPVGGWTQRAAIDGEAAGPQPITAPQPMTQAFPQARNFRPANWMLTPEEVEEGY